MGGNDLALGQQGQGSLVAGSRESHDCSWQGGPSQGLETDAVRGNCMQRLIGQLLRHTRKDETRQDWAVVPPEAGLILRAALELRVSPSRTLWGLLRQTTLPPTMSSTCLLFVEKL